MLLKLRQRMASEESGFTLVELLVVMLIIGLLAAIAIPAFFNQREKAKDSGAKEMAHTAQVAMETYATDQPNGDYAGVTPNLLKGIENSIQTAAPAPYLSIAAPQTGNTKGWTLTVVSKSGNTFQINRDAATGALTYDCVVPAANGSDRAGCPTGGNWAG